MAAFKTCGLMVAIILGASPVQVLPELPPVQGEVTRSFQTPDWSLEPMASKPQESDAKVEETTTIAVQLTPSKVAKAQSAVNEMLSGHWSTPPPSVPTVDRSRENTTGLTRSEFRSLRHAVQVYQEYYTGASGKRAQVAIAKLKIAAGFTRA